ncbi:cytochrome b/b6 domain-containing protein [Stappia sp. TSB10GB4]|uniref:cytochrome b/b6 domain-containing protein n=1 Tax=Stappia sp. TSB10GB4 TaxID=2003584 RepID=UPI001646C01A|nr:cytochrome b/b6 domain-containing protein [Stappia sp. TSB10GB4]
MPGGVFRGEEHPYRKIFTRKHNPLQALSYLALKVVLFPAIWSTGLIYLLHALWGHWDPGGFWMTIVANLHILAGFAIFTFVIIHVYLLTIGHGFLRHVRPMVTGFDRIVLTPEQEAYLRADEPERLRE